MFAIAFDTRKFAKRLKEAGVPPNQAEAEAQAIAEALEAGVSDLATKADSQNLRRDIREVGLATKADSQNLRCDIREMELRLTVKFGSLLALAVGLIVSLQKLL